MKTKKAVSTQTLIIIVIAIVIVIMFGNFIFSTSEFFKKILGV